MRTTDRRFVAAGDVAAGLVWAGPGTAAADLPADRGGIFPTEGAAYASLPSPHDSFHLHLSVFGRRGDGATAGVEVFGTYGTGEDDYFECFDGPLASATLDGLDGATAAGSTTLVCSGPNLPGDGTGHVTVDVRWEPYGRVDRSAVVIPGCRASPWDEQRAADVIGDFTVSISLPGVGDITATVEDASGLGDVGTQTGICARGRG